MNQEPNNPVKCPICERSTHKESKYCIFHASAEEKTERDFKRKLREHVEKIKEGDGDYDFKKFIFVGDINFKKDLSIDTFIKADFNKATFEYNVDFDKATFKYYVDFDKATFKEYAGFEKVTFEEDAGFDKATFEGKADFNKATFEGKADFYEATFKYYVDFDKATFKEYAGFYKATFGGDAYAGFDKTTFEGKAVFGNAIFKVGAYFGEATFKGSADFDKATFGGKADFNKAIFEGDADFRLKHFIGIIVFTEIKIFPGKKLSIRIINGGGKINFNRAYLENTILEIELVEGVFIDFTGALLRNTRIEKDQIKNHILQENEKKFTEAKEIFLLLRNNFHSIGRYEDESWAFKKEKEMERKSFSFPCYKNTLKAEGKKEKFPILKWTKEGNFLKWVILGFSNMIYGYGEKPWNVIISAGVIIIFFALLFGLIGIANPEIIELNTTTIQQNPGNIADLTSKGLLKNNIIKNFPDSLYFSLITFTTLGYGDFRPLEGWGRILAGSEAFIGAFMMALFVYTFARRTGGR